METDNRAEFGYLYVTYGAAASAAASRSVESLLRTNPAAPITWAPPNQRVSNFEKSRFAKTTMFQWSPYEHSLYLDADTVIYGDLTPGFKLLQQGWEMVVTPALRQGPHAYGHLDPEDRRLTLEAYGARQPSALFQLSAGVMWFRKTPDVQKFFETWHREWLICPRQDQGAMARALAQSPIRLFILGQDYNSQIRGQSTVVHHLFGQAISV